MSQQPVRHEASPQPQPREPTKPKPPFDIDNYLNPYIPRSPLYLLPTSVSHFLGHRPPRTPTRRPPVLHRYHNVIVYLSIFIGTFCGLSIIENTFLALPPLSGHAVPIIIASFGAAAILEYNSIESPLAQPRNLVFGHFFSAVVAVSITKLFEHLPPHRFEDLRWLSGAISVAVASLIMSATKTVHPPAGATALLASTSVEIQVLGWWLLPLVLLAAMLMLTSAMLLNNMAGRRYPVYWWTPVDLKALREEQRREKAGKQGLDVEKATTPTAPEANKAETISDEDTEAGSSIGDIRKMSNQDTDRLERTVTYTSASRTPHPGQSLSRKASKPEHGCPTKASRREDAEEEEKSDRIIITRSEIITPEWLQLNDWEDEVLRILMERLRDT
ncbi:uncharacterized protein A1O9_01368 [Exophiala aquamarina CBS 119918]|uniref:HPP transmembrane region domain-containing protein n=1 Tax=Exophiala aquamarina CBS 119918 TaxID=1182545 RepID=A0A072PU62_9EURO|nr:uncharacterized protein A1O9_01368 [Exophiala aquamarina CBS 119918]KEF63391.1 hypothetical protein A1O9_01368 [Exophiala aquamarina CBS 119918]